MRLNSGLNADFMKALDGAAENVYDLMSHFVADYELNHRQIALYLIDCELLQCDKRRDILNRFEEIAHGTSINFILDYSSTDTNDHLMEEIRVSVADLVYHGSEILVPDVQFMGKPL